MNNLVSEAYDNETGIKKRNASGISNELNKHQRKNISNDAGISSSMTSEKLDMRGQAGTQKNIKVSSITNIQFKNKFGENKITASSKSPQKRLGTEPGHQVTTSQQMRLMTMTEKPHHHAVGSSTSGILQADEGGALIPQTGSQPFKLLGSKLNQGSAQNSRNAGIGPGTQSMQIMGQGGLQAKTFHAGHQKATSGHQMYPMRATNQNQNINASAKNTSSR